MSILHQLFATSPTAVAFCQANFVTLNIKRGNQAGVDKSLVRRVLIGKIRNMLVAFNAWLAKYTTMCGNCQGSLDDKSIFMRLDPSQRHSF